MTIKQKQWSNIIRCVLSFPFLAIGVFTFAWSFFCFFGGPDGKIGSPDSLCFGAVFLFAAFLCAFLFYLVNGRKNKALLVLCFCYELVPLLIALFITTVIVIQSVKYYLDYSRWVLCRPSDVFYTLAPWGVSLAGGYGLFRLMKHSRETKNQ